MNPVQTNMSEQSNLRDTWFSFVIEWVHPFCDIGYLVLGSSIWDEGEVGLGERKREKK